MSYFGRNHFDRLQECLKLAKRKGASGAAVELSHGTSYSCEFAAGRLKNTAFSESMSYSIQVIVNGQRGFANGNVMEAMDTMLERALLLAKQGAVSHFDEYPTPEKFATIRTFSNSIKFLTRERLIGDCGEMVAALKELDPEMDIEAFGGWSETEDILVTSGGLEAKSRETSWGLGAGFSRINGEDMLFAGQNRSWGSVNKLYDVQYLIRQLGKDYRNGIRTVDFSGGKVPVLLAPAVVRQFLSPIIGGLNGRSVFKGTSPLKDKLGQKAFFDGLTVYDCPHLSYAPGTTECDDVGLPTKPCTLIQDGVIQMFMYDYDTAHMAKQAPTGHSGCSPYNVRIQPGQHSSRELLKSMKRGIYIQTLLGFGQSNLNNGDFSCNIAVGYLIENGKIAGRIKNAMIAGNIFDICAGEVLVTSDTEANYQTPHFYIPSLNVACQMA